MKILLPIAQMVEIPNQQQYNSKFPKIHNRTWQKSINAILPSKISRKTEKKEVHQGRIIMLPFTISKQSLMITQDFTITIKMKHSMRLIKESKKN